MSGLGVYAEALGIVRDGDGLALPFAGVAVGRPGFLHGGAIAGLLEAAGIDALRRAMGDPGAPIRLLTITVDYLRPGLPEATFSRGTVTRLGRRVAHVEATAWQADPGRPIGAARITLVLPPAVR